MEWDDELRRFEPLLPARGDKQSCLGRDDEAGALESRDDLLRRIEEGCRAPLEPRACRRSVGSPLRRQCAELRFEVAGPALVVGVAEDVWGR
jgi:hypothetical protein